MKKNKHIAILISLFLLAPVTAKAHCPLCTVGAGALAVGAAYIGVSTTVIGIFIGAFALALGLWVSNLVKKKYIKYQKGIIVTLIFLSTIIPMVPLIRSYTSINVFLFGEYGSVFYRTYMINTFMTGTILGALILFGSPYASKKLAKVRKEKMIPFQGMIITFTLLIIASLLIQFGL